MSYTYYRAITIDATKCGAADSSNFPVLFTGTYSWLATVGNGGRVQSSNGYDIVFASDSAGTTLYDFERVAYDAATGAGVFWVKVPTLSHTTNTVIYCLHGDASVTTDQSNKTGVWSAYSAVYHLSESSSPYLDATSNAVNSTSGTYPTQTTGLWGKAQSFASASSQYIELPNPAPSGTSLVISGWMKVSSGNFNVLYDTRVNASLLGGVVYTDSASGQPTFYFNNYGFAQGPSGIIDGNWHYLVGSSAPNVAHGRALYLDGAYVTTTSGAGVTGGMTTGSARIGAAAGASPAGFMNGLIQEVRVATYTQADATVLAEYNNQSSPSTFYTVGSENGGAGGGASAQPCFFLLM